MKNENMGKLEKEELIEKKEEVTETKEQKSRQAELTSKLKDRFESLKTKAIDTYKKSGKKTVAVLCSVLLIGGAVALNFVLFTDEAKDDGKGQLAVDLSTLTDGDTIVPTGGEADESDDYFATVNLGKKQARDEAMEVLLEVTNDENATAEAKATASADINRIALDIEREGTIESLVVAKGFEKCVAIVNGDSASVIVGGDTLTPGETAQICEIVYEAAGIIPANLKIVEKALEV